MRREFARWICMATLISNSSDETLGVGESWGRELNAGWLIGLVGELGAGKTILAKGIARGLGIQSKVKSPTFCLVSIHEGGRLTLVHLDLYRLESSREIAGAGLEEYLEDRSGIVVVEWADRWIRRPEAVGRATRWVRMEFLDASARRIIYEDFGT